MQIQQVAREIGLVAAVAAFQLFTAHAGGERPDARTELDAVGTALLVAGPLTLPLRHRAPWATVGASVLAGIVYFSLGYPGAAIFATVVVALVSLRRRRVAEKRQEQEQEQRRRLAEQRLSIARDLHDVLAHSISVIRVQAGVALHLMDTHPEQVRTALRAITAASDDGMRELRAAVGALRRDDEQAPLGPAPGLERLDALVAGARAAGLDVSEHRTGAVRPLPPEVELVAYRVVQEALTNTVRHAGASTTEVVLEYGDDVLVVQVDDDGSGGSHTAPPVGGTGLLGMRERVAGLGGVLETGPRPGRGFRVRAVLPVSLM